MYIEINYNENTMTPNLLDTPKEILKGKFTAIQSNLNNKKNFKQSNLTPKANRERNTKKIQSQKKKINHEDRSRNK